MADEQGESLGFLDRQFKDTNIVILILFPLCCGVIALIFGIVGVAACQHPIARRNAIIVLAIGGARFALVIVFAFLNALLQAMP